MLTEISKLGKNIYRSKLLFSGVIILAIILILTVLAPYITPYDPDTSDFMNRLKPPSVQHWLGTDTFGRDVLTRILYGSRLSLRIGLLVVIFNGILGTTLGLLSGYYRKLDTPIMRAMDVMMSFPEIFLGIAIMAILGGGEQNVILALGIVLTPRTARIIRSAVLKVVNEEYIEAIRALGGSDRRILFRHVLPNCLSPLIVQLTFIFAYAILAEAALSFIGVGSPPPTPSWGNILSEGRDYIPVAPWITLYPGIAIAATVLGLNLAGDGLRDVLDPKMDI